MFAVQEQKTTFVNTLVQKAREMHVATIREACEGRIPYELHLYAEVNKHRTYWGSWRTKGILQVKRNKNNSESYILPQTNANTAISMRRHLEMGTTNSMILPQYLKSTKGKASVVCFPGMSGAAPSSRKRHRTETKLSSGGGKNILRYTFTHEPGHKIIS